MQSRYILPFVALFLLAGCENTFTPKAPYEERIVVFSVLDPTAAYQVVRLESTYDADLSNPDEPLTQNVVDSARVTISTPRKSFVFHDTLIALPDGSQKRVWVNYDLVPTEGIDYTLAVDVPGFERISASTQVPSRAYVQIRNTVTGLLVIGEDETAYPPDAFQFRLWVVGEKVEGGNTTEIRKEVLWRKENTGSEDEWVYTEPSRASEIKFSIDKIVEAQEQLRAEQNVSGKYLAATSYSLDKFIYSYYKLVRGFDDPVSVRQDLPDVSNIRNGVGIFGALYPDSTRVSYSSIVTQ